MEKATLYLPTDLMAAYSALAHRNWQSKAALMREALRDYAERERQPLPDWVGMLETDGAVNSTNVKAWLAEN